MCVCVYKTEMYLNSRIINNLELLDIVLLAHYHMSYDGTQTYFQCSLLCMSILNILVSRTTLFFSIIIRVPV